MNSSSTQRLWHSVCSQNVTTFGFSIVLRKASEGARATKATAALIRLKNPRLFTAQP